LAAQVFTWRESLGDCWDDDFVNVTFIQVPTPTTISNFDTVCANAYQLNAMNSIYSGSWNAYTGDPLVPMMPAPLYSPSIYDPNATATIPNYTEESKDVTFIWTETNQVNGVECVGEAIVNVTFAKRPQAAVAENSAEICGSCVQLSAINIGISGYEYFWIPKVNGEFTKSRRCRSN
jgi:hypothetical protein